MSTIRTASTPATMRTRVRSRYDGLSGIRPLLLPEARVARLRELIGRGKHVEQPPDERDAVAVIRRDGELVRALDGAAVHQRLDDDHRSAASRRERPPPAPCPQALPPRQ